MDEAINRDILIFNRSIDKNNLEKMTNFYYLMDFWMEALENNKSVLSFFQNRKYENIAVYGMGKLGKHLVKQLNSSGKNISFYIDKKKIYYNERVLELSAKNCNRVHTDVIVVTPILEYKKIKEELLEFFPEIDIVSLEEVILSI